MTRINPSCREFTPRGSARPGLSTRQLSGDQFRDDLRTRIPRLHGVEINHLPVDSHGLVHPCDLYDSQERNFPGFRSLAARSQTPIAATAAALLTRPPEEAQCWIGNRR